jgi:hypothetical protein
MARREPKTLFSYSKSPIVDCIPSSARSRHVDGAVGTTFPRLSHNKPERNELEDIIGKPCTVPAPAPTVKPRILTTSNAAGSERGELIITTTNTDIDEAQMAMLTGEAPSRVATDTAVQRAIDIWQQATATQGQPCHNQLYPTVDSVVRQMTTVSHYNDTGLSSLYNTVNWDTARYGLSTTYYVALARTEAWDTVEQVKQQLIEAVQAAYSITAEVPTVHMSKVQGRDHWKAKLVLPSTADLMQFAFSHHARLAHLPVIDKDGNAATGLPTVRPAHAPVNEHLVQEQQLTGCQVNWQSHGPNYPMAAVQQVVRTVLQQFPDVPRNSWFLQLFEIASIEYLQGTQPRRYKMVMCHPRACEAMELLQHVRAQVTVWEGAGAARQKLTTQITVVYSVEQDEQIKKTRDILQHSLGTSALQEPTLALHPAHMLSMVTRLTKKAEDKIQTSTKIPQATRAANAIWLYNTVTGQPVTPSDLTEDNIMQVLVLARGTPLSTLDAEAVAEASRTRMGLRLLIPLCDARSLYFMVGAAAGGLLVPEQQLATSQVHFNITQYHPLRDNGPIRNGRWLWRTRPPAYSASPWRASRSAC